MMSACHRVMCYCCGWVVCRKFRYEQQKKKREAQRKVMANRQEIKELKMRWAWETGGLSWGTTVLSQEQ